MKSLEILKDIVNDAKQGTLLSDEQILFLEKIVSLQSVNAWVARKFYGDLYVFQHEPIKTDPKYDWCDDTGNMISLPANIFPELKHISDPIEVEIMIIPKNK